MYQPCLTFHLHLTELITLFVHSDFGFSNTDFFITFLVYYKERETDTNVDATWF